MEETRDEETPEVANTATPEESDDPAEEDKLPDNTDEKFWEDKPSHTKAESRRDEEGPKEVNAATHEESDDQAEEDKPPGDSAESLLEISQRVHPGHLT